MKSNSKFLLLSYFFLAACSSAPSAPDATSSTIASPEKVATETRYTSLHQLFYDQMLNEQFSLNDKLKSCEKFCEPETDRSLAKTLGAFYQLVSSKNPEATKQISPAMLELEKYRNRIKDKPKESVAAIFHGWYLVGALASIRSSQATPYFEKIKSDLHRIQQKNTKIEGLNYLLALEAFSDQQLETGIKESQKCLAQMPNFKKCLSLNAKLLEAFQSPSCLKESMNSGIEVSFADLKSNPPFINKFTDEKTKITYFKTPKPVLLAAATNLVRTFGVDQNTVVFEITENSVGQIEKYSTGRKEKSLILTKEDKLLGHIPYMQSGLTHQRLIFKLANSTPFTTFCSNPTKRAPGSLVTVLPSK